MATTRIEAWAPRAPRYPYPDVPSGRPFGPSGRSGISFLVASVVRLLIVRLLETGTDALYGANSGVGADLRFGPERAEFRGRADQQEGLVAVNPDSGPFGASRDVLGGLGRKAEFDGVGDDALAPIAAGPLEVARELAVGGDVEFLDPGGPVPNPFGPELFADERRVPG